MTKTRERAIFCFLATCFLTIVAHSSLAAGGSCMHERRHQRQVVEAAIDNWFSGTPRAQDLIDLVQADQGAAVCALGERKNLEHLRLHTATLPEDVGLFELGGIILANELSWSKILPPSEEGLAGHTFWVAP